MAPFSGISRQVFPIVPATLIQGLESTYNFNILCLLPLVLIIVLLALKVDTVVAFIASAFSGVILGCIFQGANFFDACASLWNGYVSNSGIEEIDSLLSMGGLMANAGLILLLFVAFLFAGVLREIKLLDVLLGSVVGKIKNPGLLVAAAEITGLIGVFVSTSVFVSVILNASIYKDAFEEKGYVPEVLGRALQEGCAMTSCYVPWSGGVFLMGAPGGAHLMFYSF